MLLVSSLEEPSLNINRAAGSRDWDFYSFFQLMGGNRWRRYLRYCAAAARSQVRFPMLSSFRPHYDPEVDSASEHKWVPWIFPGGIRGWCFRLAALPPSQADWLEIWEPKSLITLRACPEIALPLFHSAYIAEYRDSIIRWQNSLLPYNMYMSFMTTFVIWLHINSALVTASLWWDSRRDVGKKSGWKWENI